MVGYSEGLNLSNIDETTQEEIDAHINHRWRQSLYEMYAPSLMTDYAPDIAKLHRWAADIFGRPNPVNVLPNAILQLHSYIFLGHEKGIFNQFKVLQKQGLTRSQIMEIVMFARLVAGMRGLGHVYQAIGESLSFFPDGHGHPTFPDGWAADPAAFHSGLDMTTREFTDEDRKNLTAWYENTIGYVPASIAFGMRTMPQFLKVHRLMWERAIKTLPKQVAPYMMIRDAMLANDHDALREAVLLGQAWGMSSQSILLAIGNTANYFTGLRGLYGAHAAIDDLIE